VEVTPEAFATYQAGALVQAVWPDMSFDDREIIISSRMGLYICPTCWNESFNDEEDVA